MNELNILQKLIKDCEQRQRRTSDFDERKFIKNVIKDLKKLIIILNSSKG